MINHTLENKGALKLFGNRFLNKCGGVSHSHSLSLQLQKEKEIEKKNTTRKRKANKKKIRVDPLIHWIGCLLYEKKMIS